MIVSYPSLSHLYRYLNGFELFVKGKMRGSGVPKESPSRGRKKAPLLTQMEQEEETERRERAAEDRSSEKSHRITEGEARVKTEALDRSEQRTTRLSKQTTSRDDLSWSFFSRSGVREAPPSSLFPSSSSSPPLLPPHPTSSSLSYTSPVRGQPGEVGTFGGGGESKDVRSSPRTQSLRDLHAELMEDVGKRGEKMSSSSSHHKMATDCKTELSDQESSQVIHVPIIYRLERPNNL